MNLHRRSYRIGYGYCCEFTLDLDAIKPGSIDLAGLKCEWEPSMPSISGKGAQERFVASYRRARDDFMQDIAQLLGGNVLNLDIDQYGNILATSCASPQAKN